MFSSDAPVEICILKFYPNHSTLAYLRQYEFSTGIETLSARNEGRVHIVVL
jgi:hypothetical protein